MEFSSSHFVQIRLTITLPIFAVVVKGGGQRKTEVEIGLGDGHNYISNSLNREDAKDAKGVFVGFVQILKEGPQLNTLRCHGHEFHGAGSGSEHTKP
jgi:hypothetical protein